LERGELRVHYQPIVRAGSHQLAAVEALLRWERPGGAMLTAGAFIDIAVRTGHIVTIGRWVIAEACHQMAAWQSQLPGVAPAAVYVNLSARELADDDLLDTIATALSDTGLSAHHLGIEVVEEDLADLTAIDRLRQLHERGHRLSIDDFGTGYSSLSRLLDMPAELAKIDRSIVDGIPDDPRRVRFMDGVLLMAGTLDLEVIAEGVETTDQAEHLSDVGCPLLQGYFLARPQSARDLTVSWSSPEGRNA
jgi:EAL domain-containing protein (putative c-di-GMP-specific phosphodiesterase class I)